MNRSINILDHYWVEILKGNLSIFVWISFLKNKEKGLVIKVFLDVIVDLFDVVDCQIVLVFSVVLFEYRCNLFFLFVSEWLGVHRFHELDETDATRLLNIELSHNLVGGLSVGFKTVLSEKQFDIIGEQNSHACRIVGVENLLQVKDILIGEWSCHI